MRVIAGSAKGTPLVAPKGRDVRPTLDRVREALFSILMPRLSGAAFLDLFAGTGTMGIEALSRGAERASFVDNDPQSVAVIERNLAATRLAAHARLHRLTLPNGVDALARDGRVYDVVVADPPYAFPHYAELLARLDATGLVARDGLVVVEHAARMAMPERGGAFVSVRLATYGDTGLTFYQYPADSASEG